MSILSVMAFDLEKCKERNQNQGRCALSLGSIRIAIACAKKFDRKKSPEISFMIASFSRTDLWLAFRARPTPPTGGKQSSQMRMLAFTIGCKGLDPSDLLTGRSRSMFFLV
jgi:hypothetical protein